MGRLPSGAALQKDQALLSDNGGYKLILQNDGNLVLYALATGQPQALWASGTQRGVRAQMQPDGNFVIVEVVTGGDFPGEYPLWNARTDGHRGSYLNVQDDGNVVIYDPLSGQAIWTQSRLNSNSYLMPGGMLASLNGLVRLEFQQGDGNLVLYQSKSVGDQNRTATWSPVPSIANKQAITAMLQDDGNLVVWGGPELDVLWQSGKTGPMGQYYLQVQNDGNLVIYTQNRQVLWHANLVAGAHA